MNKLTELMTEHSEELFDLAVVNEKPLSKREAKKAAARIVRAEKPARRFSFRRPAAILAAAAIALCGISVGALSAGTLLFDGEGPSEDPSLVSTLSTSFSGDYAEKLDWEDADIVDAPGVSTEANGVTVAVSRVIPAGVFTVMEIEVTVPDKGAVIPERNFSEEHDLYYGFNRRAFACGEVNPKAESIDYKDDIPGDGKFAFYWVAAIDQIPEEQEISILLGDLAYEIDGELKMIEGNWNLTWNQDVPTDSITKTFDEPVRFVSEQELTAVELHPNWMKMNIAFTEAFDPATDPQILAPVILLKDGTELAIGYPFAQNDMNTLRTATEVNIAFEKAVDLDEISGLKLGDTVVTLS